MSMWMASFKSPRTSKVDGRMASFVEEPLERSRIE